MKAIFFHILKIKFNILFIKYRSIGFKFTLTYIFKFYFINTAINEIILYENK